MKKVYSFDKQLAIGNKAENMVRAWLSKAGYGVNDSTMAQQKVGIDFIINGVEKIEVKLDNYCQKNGRYFLEIELPNKDGWVHTCTADFIYLVVGGTWDVKVVKPEKLRYWIEIWKRRYGVRTCENKNNYWSNGVCVPLTEIPGEVYNLSKFAEN